MQNVGAVDGLGKPPEVFMMSKATRDVFDITPVERERLSASDFLELVRKNPGVIKSSRAIPATLGSSGFGLFEVEYTRPQYRDISFRKSAA